MTTEDPDDVQSDECHGCGHSATVCNCERPAIDNSSLMVGGDRERFVIFTKSARDENAWSWSDMNGSLDAAAAELARLRTQYPNRKWWMVRQMIKEEVLDV